MSIIDTRTHTREDEVLRALLARLLAAALGDEANKGAYHAIVDRYPATAILCAFETAQGLPSSMIRKTRGAYFTFLLQRLCPQAPITACQTAKVEADSEGVASTWERPQWSPLP